MGTRECDRKIGTSRLEQWGTIVGISKYSADCKCVISHVLSSQSLPMHIITCVKNVTASNKAWPCGCHVTHIVNDLTRSVHGNTLIQWVGITDDSFPRQNCRLEATLLLLCYSSLILNWLRRGSNGKLAVIFLRTSTNVTVNWLRKSCAKLWCLRWCSSRGKSGCEPETVAIVLQLSRIMLSGVFRSRIYLGI